MKSLSVLLVIFALSYCLVGGQESPVEINDERQGDDMVDVGDDNAVESGNDNGDDNIAPNPGPAPPSDSQGDSQKSDSPSDKHDKSDRGHGKSNRGRGRRNRRHGKSDRGHGKSDRGHDHRRNRGYGGYGKSDRGHGHRRNRGFGRLDRGHHHGYYGKVEEFDGFGYGYRRDDWHHYDKFDRRYRRSGHGSHRHGRRNIGHHRGDRFRQHRSDDSY